MSGCVILGIKGATAHKVVNLQLGYKPACTRLSDKAGLFIFACYSYQYRQAAQSGSYHLKITGLKSVIIDKGIII